METLEQNRLNQKVYRVFYRCENCWSRINEDFIPEMDDMKTIDLTDSEARLNFFNHIK